MRSSRGFTLFELMVAIAVVALIIGITVTQLGQYLELDMRKTSNKLASTVRYLYNKSVTDGMYLRLVLNLDERTYWVEATSDPMRITQDMEIGGPDEARPQDEMKEGGGPPEAETWGLDELGEGERPKITYPKPSFGQVDSFLLQPTKLPGSVFFKDVFVEHRPNGVEGGKVGIYFFPNGYVERAIINLRNEEDDYFYSLETNPVTGKVSVKNEYRTMEGP